MTVSVVVKHLKPWQLSVTIKCLNLVIFYRHHAPVDRWAGKSSARQANIAGDTCSQYQNWRIEPHTPPADPRRPQHPPPASLVSRALDAASARIRGPRTRLDSPFGIVNWGSRVLVVPETVFLSHLPFLLFSFYIFYIFWTRESFSRGLGIANGNLVKVGTKTRQPCSFWSRLKGERWKCSGFVFLPVREGNVKRSAVFLFFSFKEETRGRRRQRVSSMCAWHAYWAFVACSFLPGVVAVVVVVVVLNCCCHCLSCLCDWFITRWTFFPSHLSFRRFDI